MRSLSLGIFSLILLFSSESWSDTLTWNWTEHDVQFTDTLRSIALRYFGTKDAAVCLQDQLRLPDPNYIRDGDHLGFLAPSRKLNSAQYHELRLKCFPQRVLSRKLEAPSVAPETQPQTEVVPERVFLEPASLKTTWDFAAKLGAGASYININQSLSGDVSDYGGALDFHSLATTSFLAEAKMTLNERWFLSLSWMSLPGQLSSPQSAGSAQPSYRWESAELDFGCQPRSSQLHLGEWIVAPAINVGVLNSRWPLVAATSTQSVAVDQIPTDLVTLGFGLDVSSKENWRISSGFEWAWPFQSEQVTLNSNYFVSAYLDLERRLSGNWFLGLDWRGLALEIPFSSYDSGGQTQVQASTFFLSLSYILPDAL